MAVSKRQNQKNKLAFSALLAGFLLFNSNALPAAAKTTTPNWAAEKYSKIEEVEMAPGKTQKIKIGFYNRGLYNWRNTGKNFISLYTYKPKYRASVFYNKAWFSKIQPARLKDSLAGPGSKGYFEFYLTAPSKLGVYKETFAIATENKSWIPGGQFTLTIKVTADNQDKGNIEEELNKNVFLSPPKIEMKKQDLEAWRLTKINPVVLHYGEETKISILIMNKGKNSWQDRSIFINKISTLGVGTAVSFANQEWKNENTVLENNQNLVKTGETEIYTIPLKAPERSGVYTLHFNLITNGKTIDGGSLDIPVTVINQNPTEYVAVAETIITDEPLIRVGLFTTEEETQFSSPFVYQLKNSNGENLGEINPGITAVLSFDEGKKIYKGKIGLTEIISEKPLRLVSTDPNGYFTILNYKFNPRWNVNINYNQFRGTLEIRWAGKTGYLWVINELSMENYLKGMAEENDSSPVEFLKTMAVAERSYAYYHLKNPAKHEAGGFTVDAENDQVYRGYVREKMSPNTVAAAEATLGIVVTYNNETAFTPYFARSNGKTKSAKVVWGTDRPWLQSVITPYDKGKTQWGHGVGMSARDGLYRAKNGANWEDILKYYYTGIELQKMY